MSQTEAKINSLIAEFTKKMKEAISRKINEESDQNELLKYINDYPMLTIKEQDYSKRKRVKTNVPLYEKCLAKRANGEQCSRRKKNESDFCGTHTKGCPHGVMSKQENIETNGTTYNCNTVNDSGAQTSSTGVIKKQIQVWLEDINGIMFWINDAGAVYDTGDVMNNVENPRVIAKYEKNMEGDTEVYKIIGEVH
jgi:hypothetical protein